MTDKPNPPIQKGGNPSPLPTPPAPVPATEPEEKPVDLDPLIKEYQDKHGRL